MIGLRTPTFHDRSDKLLQALERETSFAGETVKFNPRIWASRCWCLDNSELNEVLTFLESEKRVVKQATPDNDLAARIAPAGWAHLEKLKQINVQSRQAFVAMCFDPSLKYIYEEALAPAIAAAGYFPRKIDQKEEFLGKIDDEVIAEIRKSRFLVADLTQQRQNVYYEAGFAHGMGIRVIFTCKKEEVDANQLRFDVRQYVTIDWSTPEELYERLKNKIEANLGHGPFQPMPKEP